MPWDRHIWWHVINIQWGHACLSIHVYDGFAKECLKWQCCYEKVYRRSMRSLNRWLMVKGQTHSHEKTTKTGFLVALTLIYIQLVYKVCSPVFACKVCYEKIWLTLEIDIAWGTLIRLKRREDESFYSPTQDTTHNGNDSLLHWLACIQLTIVSCIQIGWTVCTTESK